MTSTEFKTYVSMYFGHYLPLFDFQVSGGFTLSGKLYESTYETNNRALTVSYEPGDDYLVIMLFEKNGDSWSDFDDTSATKSLNQLNKEYFSKIDESEIREIDQYFNGLVAENEDSKLMKKKARELIVCFHVMKRQGKL